jgi:hypothetical protein
VRSDRCRGILSVTTAVGCAVAIALSMSACSSPKSFVVLTLRSMDPTPIPDVTDVVVVVSQTSTHMTKTLIYPPQAPSAHITIDQVTKTDLSVSFTGAQSGTVDLAVTARNAAGCSVGFGQTTAVIKMGNVSTASVDLAVVNEDCNQADGGADARGDAFPGCDPVTPLCAAGQTCQVNCTKKVGECTAGGNGAPGTPCQLNADCRPGSQCFDYSATGCNVKLCLRFCNDEIGCGTTTTGSGDGGAGGSTGNSVGTRSLCMGPVQCGTIVTAYRTCTFACDPRQAAIAASGCPTGLSCLVVAGMDQVDCACPEKTRTGTDGSDCTGSAQCAPGFICNMMGATRKCRAVCRCNATGMTCTAPNDCKMAGTSCVPLTNDTVFGVCML